MTEREALKLALEALEDSEDQLAKPYSTDVRRAITAIKEALAQPEQEPVAWKDKTYGNLHHQDFGNSIPLYTTPPQRTWVGLTDEDLEPMCDDWRIIFGPYVHDFSKAIEAKLKEKNNGN